MAEDNESPKTDTRAASPSDFGRNDSRLLQTDKDAETLSKRPEDALQADEGAPLDRSNSDFANIHYGAPEEVDPLTPENVEDAEDDAQFAESERLELDTDSLDAAQSEKLPDGARSPALSSDDADSDTPPTAEHQGRRGNTSDAEAIKAPLPGESDAPSTVNRAGFVAPDSDDDLSPDALSTEEDLAARDVPVDFLEVPPTVPFDIIGGDLQETVSSGGTISSAYDPSGLSVAQMRSAQPGVSYTLVDATGNPIDHPLFEVIGSGIYVKLGVEIDYESNPSIDVFVQARDASGQTTTQSLTIDVTDFEGLGIGTSGNDRIRGTSEEDALVGGDGNDRLYGNGGADSFDGGAGNDILYVDADDVSVQGGEGTDRVIVQGSEGVTLDLTASSIERADGGAGDDVFDATGSTDRVRLFGRDGDDTLTGGDGNDIIRGGDGTDTLMGGAGNDQLRGDDGADILDGGAGNDTLYIDADDVSIQGGEGTDRVIVQGTEGVTLDLTASSIERADGGAGDDVFDATGSTDRVRLFGRDGDDTLTGGDGNDIIRGGDGTDTLMGGAGNDQLRGDGGADTLDGGAGNDTLYIDADDVSIQGGEGTDRVIVQGSDGVTLDLTASSIERADGGAGDDVFDATGSIDRVRLFGRDGDDTLTGGDGNDIIRGGDGTDTLMGGAGNDQLRGDGGADILDGGAGNDTLYIDADDVSIQGGEGTDRVIVQGSDGVTLDLTASSIERADGGAGDDVFDATGSTDRVRLYGRDGDDTLTGGDGNDIIRGGDGDDILRGGAGNDTLRGDDGNDRIYVSSGNERIIGGDGDDTVVFSGSRADYLVTELTGGQFRITDLRVGSPDGINRISEIEHFEFSDNIINVDDILNAPPSAIQMVGGDIIENAVAGSVVGTLRAIDPDSPETFTYQFVDFAGDPMDHPMFEIVGDEIRVKAGVDLSFEDQASFDFDIEVTDSVGNTYVQGLSVDVLDENEAPTAVRLENVVSELSEGIDTSARVKIADIVVDDDALGTNNLALSGDDADHFEIVGDELYLKAGASLDFETQASLDVTVEVDDASLGGTPDATESLTLSVLDANEAPTGIRLDLALTELPEDLSTLTRTKVADIVVDDDALGSFNLSLNGLDAASFEIEGNELYLKAGVNLDFAIKPTFDVSVEVDDPSVGGTPDASVSLSFDVLEINDGPSAVTLSNVVTNLDEDTDTSSRVKIADIDVTDDGLGTNNLTLSGSDAEHFEIIGNELYLKAGTDLDFETHPTFDVTVEADDPDTPSDPDATVSTSLNLVNVNEAPTDIIVDKLRQGVSMNEDGGNNAYLRAENSDFLVDQDTFTFEISFAGDQQGSNFTPLASYAVPGSNNEFLIGGHPSDGHLSVFFRTQKVETSIDLDDLFDGDVHHLAVTRDSSDGSLEVYVDGVLEWQTSNIQTGANLRGDGSLVFGQEQDSVDGGFSSAQVFQGTLLDVAVYDDVRTADEVASDAAGGTGDGLVVNWDLSGFSGGTALSGDGSNALVENTVSGSGFHSGTGSTVSDLGLPETISEGTVVATLSAVDEDTLDTATFEIVGGSSQFEIVGNEVRVKAGASFDYETTPVESLDVRVTDSAGNTYTETISFDIADVNEAPTAVTLENVVTDLGEDVDTSSRIKIADISVSDDALGTNDLTLSGADADSFEIIGNELFLKAGTALDFENKTSFDVTVQVDDASVGSTPDASVSMSLGITDASENLVLSDGGVTFTDTDMQETSVTGGDGDDSITGTSGNDILSGGAGADLLQGGDGDDTFTLNGADGTWSGYAAQHTETGERVSLSGLQQNEDVIRGGDGTDTVVTTDSADALFLDDGFSAQNADASGARFDSIERFELGGGDDVFDFTSRTYTYETDTTVDGGAGDDTIWAADGDDTLIGGAGDDSIHGGAGTDTAVFTGNASDYTITQLDTTQYQIVDNRAGSPDGSDVVTDVEFLQFADGTLSATDFDNQAPTSVTLSNVVSSFAEDTDTSSRIKVADIAVGDDGQGTNVLSLAGADAGSFEIIGNELFLKAGTSLDFESKTAFDVTVQVDDASVGGTPDATASMSLGVTDANDAPTDIVFHQAHGTQDAGATYTDTGIKIDGVSDDAWSGAASYSLSDTVSGSVADSDDLSGSFDVMWDADKIYFRARIVDDAVVGDEGGANWQDDSVEFYLDIGNDQTGTYDTTDFQFVVGQGSDNIDLHRSGKLVSSAPTGAESATELTSDGYTTEFSITWESLGLKAPTENMDIGFGFAVNDDDDGGARDGQMMWDTNSGSLWNDTSQFGQLTLEPVSPALSVVEESAGATIGSLSVIDSDSAESFSFAVSDSRFEVVDNDGSYDLKLKDGESLDYEVDGDHVDLSVTVTDASGGTYTEKFSVAVEDVDDTIDGTSGNDTLTGDASDNTIYALDGDDTIRAGDGDDTVYMGAGDDTFDTTVGDADDGDGIDTVYGESGRDTIWGGGGGDTLDGGADADYINGEAGDDTIIGGLGDDNLYGGSGDDLFIFHEGDGNDTMSGGSGWTDTIELFNADGSGAPDSAWTIELDGGRSATFSSADGYLDLGADASGTITFDNGDVIDFSGIERIEW